LSRDAKAELTTEDRRQWKYKIAVLDDYQNVILRRGGASLNP
jgi:hypothetical protein